MRQQYRLSLKSYRIGPRAFELLCVPFYRSFSHILEGKIKTTSRDAKKNLYETTALDAGCFFKIKTEKMKNYFCLLEETWFGHSIAQWYVDKFSNKVYFFFSNKILKYFVDQINKCNFYIIFITTTITGAQFCNFLTTLLIVYFTKRFYQ